MAKPFRYRRMVEFADTDMAGIMHFSAFFRFMEGAEHALVREAGLSIFCKVPANEGPDSDGNRIEVSFPRVHADCDYKLPARCEDWLEVEVTVEKLGRTSITYCHQIFRGEQLLASGSMVCVCCQMHEDKPPEPIELPDFVVEHLSPFLAAAE